MATFLDRLRNYQPGAMGMLGANILAANQPSRLPVNTMSVLGTGAVNAQKQIQAYRNANARTAELQRRTEEITRRNDLAATKEKRAASAAEATARRKEDAASHYSALQEEGGGNSPAGRMALTGMGVNPNQIYPSTGGAAARPTSVAGIPGLIRTGEKFTLDGVEVSGSEVMKLQTQTRDKSRRDRFTFPEYYDENTGETVPVRTHNEGLNAGKMERLVANGDGTTSWKPFVPGEGISRETGARGRKTLDLRMKGAINKLAEKGGGADALESASLTKQALTAYQSYQDNPKLQGAGQLAIAQYFLDQVDPTNRGQKFSTERLEGLPPVWQKVGESISRLVEEGEFADPDMAWNLISLMNAHTSTAKKIASEGRSDAEKLKFPEARPTNIVTSDEDFDALESGDTFTGPDGVPRVKK